MGNCWGTSPPVAGSHSPAAAEETPAAADLDSKKVDGLAGKDDESKMKSELKMFTLAELKSATRNFRADTEVGGDGGSGRVFKGWIDETTYAPSPVGVGMAIAVKKSNPDSLLGLQELEAEVELLGKLSHPNLVRLVGYCREDNENKFFFVYEYMQRGALENHLFTIKWAQALSWEIRLKVAIGVARCLHYLHTLPQPVIHRDLKPSNIFLDQNLNAKLSGFGLAKLGPANDSSHLSTEVMGTYGYAAPEYIATGRLYLKSDVYGFGVVLLELVTGLRAVDKNRPANQQNLVDWAKPSLSEKKMVKKIMDPRLEDRYPKEGARLVSDLVLKCVQNQPDNRPSMGQVVDALEKINAIDVK